MQENNFLHQSLLVWCAMTTITLNIRVSTQFNAISPHSSNTYVASTLKTWILRNQLVGQILFKNDAFFFRKTIAFGKFYRFGHIRSYMYSTCKEIIFYIKVNLSGAHTCNFDITFHSLPFQYGADQSHSIPFHSNTAEVHSIPRWRKSIPFPSHSIHLHPFPIGPL